ncbi:MAG: glycosyltransferase family 4 protein [Patescibacteria group bacterium]|nr:glycosyltransferase family 4 protein [Patescibacteria group bacterium]
MKVLMISLDKNLLGVKMSFGDAIDRHKIYGKYVDRLDIIVMNKKSVGKSEIFKIAENIKSYPTNSLSRFFYFLNVYKLGKKIYKSRKFDLIVCQDPFLTGLAGFLLKKKTKAKLIVHSHGDFFGNFFWLKENWFNLFLILIGKFVIKKADAIRVVSQGIFDKLVKIGINKKKIYRISTPVDLEKFSKFNNEKVLEIKNKYCNKKIVLFVGRLVKAKNIFLLIDSFKQVLKEYQNTVLLIVGDGEQKEILRARIKKENLENIIFLLGAVNHNELPNYYKASEFFVLSSTNESFGKVLIEAAATSKPSVASDTVGAREIIQKDKTGFIVPINNKKELSEKILLLLKDKEKTKEMGRRAYDYVFNNFGFQASVKKIIKMWEGTIKS